MNWRGRAGLAAAPGPVRGVSFTVGREKLGIVGESGSGKSVTGRAILKLVAPPGRVEAERLEFDGIDLLRAGKRQMRAVRGRRISMVMQDPKFSLNPVMTVGRQIAEAYLTHADVSRAEARRRTLEMLEAVRIRDPERVYGAYPHEVSGGMGQRIMIAMMLIPDPDLLIADEPTSALDVSVQAEVLNLLVALRRERGLTYILVSHNLAVVSYMCDRLAVMNHGSVVEDLTAAQLKSGEPQHPYTRQLLTASLGYDRAAIDAFQDFAAEA